MIHPPVLLQRWLPRLAIDRAVLFAVAARLWQFAAGPVTVVLHAHFFTETEQGYFYAFGSMLAIQAFFELGLSSVLISLSAHEYAVLSGESAGVPQRARERLASLLRWAQRWYAVAALLFVVAMALTGAFFFDRPTDPSLAWQLPWLCIVSLTGLTLWLTPSVAVLEGCNQIVAVYRIRFWQAITGNLMVWAAIVAGLGIWAAVVAAAVQLLWQSWLVRIRYRHFLAGRFSEATAPVAEQPAGRDAGPAELSWRQEVLPLQWRLAVQGIALHLGTALFTLIIFHYHGAAAGGRMGMTWTVMVAIQSIAYAWLQTSFPRFNRLASAGNFSELDRQYRRNLTVSGGLLAALLVALVGLISALPWIDPRIASRLLEPRTVAIFSLGMLAMHVVISQGFYLRAHRRDPLLWVGSGTSLLLGAAGWYLGRMGGPAGAAVAYAGVTCGVMLPLYSWVWLDCRRRWHAAHPSLPSSRTPEPQEL